MKIMISACLTGENCKYDGGNNKDEKLLEKLEGHTLILVCPEVMGGLPVPRIPSEIRDNEVINKEGKSVDREFRLGARKCLEIARKEQPDMVILKSRSPSCGVKQHYDGTFTGTLTDGPGVTAELLLQNGFHVVDVEDYGKEIPEYNRGKHAARGRKQMIYIASPFFSEDEIRILSQVEEILSRRGYEYFSPREHEIRDGAPGSSEWSQAAFLMDRAAIDECEVLLMIYHGNYSDSGTSWECGYAYAKGKPVIAVHIGDNSNLMVHESATANISLEELETYDFHERSEKKYSGKMY